MRLGRGKPGALAPMLASDGDMGEKAARGYRRLWVYSVTLTALVALVPLILMTAINHQQFSRALRAEIVAPISRLTSNARRSIEGFINEHMAALTFIVTEKSYAELADRSKLAVTLANMKSSFGGFVDLGVLDAQGLQQYYMGPYQMQGKSYSGQDWFHEVSVKGSYVSEVFLGYRNFPHFVIAVKQLRPESGDFYVLRATVNTDALEHYLSSLNSETTSDAFLINRDGVVQSRTRFSGKLLEASAFETPPLSTQTEVIETTSAGGERFVLGYAYIRNSPYVLVVARRADLLMASWLSVSNNSFWLLAASGVLILIVILWGSTYMVSRIRTADLRRAKAFNNIQYTNKMASIGRLAAGVAHEINNPLAIIQENAGLMEDLVAMREDMPDRKRYLKIVASILKSVGRCSAITHRLLGFAKRMDSKTDPIELEMLILEVLGFMGKEAEHRNVRVNCTSMGNVPQIESDRGQLQQVFLNIITNAFAAVDDGGQIDIKIEQSNEQSVDVTVADNGHGIPKENLERIFEPFFTTKREYGTGLGLSITYGIVEKLGGTIDVQSRPGEGTSFTITLPVNQSPMGD